MNRLLFLVCFLLVSGCNTQDTFVIEKKVSEEKFYAKVQEITIYYSENHLVELTFDVLIEEEELLERLKSFQVEFQLVSGDEQCSFYEFYRLYDRTLSMSIYSDIITCDFFEGYDLKTQKGIESNFEEKISRLQFHIISKEDDKIYPVNLSNTKVTYEKMLPDRNRPV